MIPPQGHASDGFVTDNLLLLPAISRTASLTLFSKVVGRTHRLTDILSPRDRRHGVFILLRSGA